MGMGYYKIPTYHGNGVLQNTNIPWEWGITKYQHTMGIRDINGYTLPFI
jgi:hypothetical protein